MILLKFLERFLPTDFSNDRHNQKLIHNPVKHLRRSFPRKKKRLSVINYVCKMLHLRCFTGFWVHLSPQRIINIFLWKFCRYIFLIESDWSVKLLDWNRLDCATCSLNLIGLCCLLIESDWSDVLVDWNRLGCATCWLNLIGLCCLLIESEWSVLLVDWIWLMCAAWWGVAAEIEWNVDHNYLLMGYACSEIWIT